ncbi:hypothetical protein [Streptomyces sp. NRRL F-5126]|uniref:hypothetical protein n=1 Tax=Streptomyces sp. NRRL F-5126 TaxID=1463857 RepID=UPI00131C7FC4|nr:hypothetical protein [Streptomyces sp. NRRL F-5126]
MKKESFYVPNVADKDLAALPPGTRSWIRTQEERVGFVVQEIEQYQDDHPPKPRKSRKPRSAAEIEKEETERHAKLEMLHWRKVREERPFSIHLEAPGNALLCRVEPADGSHQIHAADGTLLARTTRHKGRIVPWPRRARWELALPSQDLPYEATEGSVIGWILYSIWFPLVVALFLAMMFFLDGNAIFLGSGDPTRTKWRTATSRCGLKYRKNVYHTDPEELDHRIAYAQAVIHRWRTNVV